MPSRILVFHNRYRWPGGEDTVVRDEIDLLHTRGHEMMEHIEDNRSVLNRGRVATLATLWRAAWSKRVYVETQELVRKVRPDIVHVHNFWFALSPSVVTACHDVGLPVVATLHNFRLLCVGGVLLDPRGQACDHCVGRSPAPGVRRGCYRSSHLLSYFVARMIKVNRKRGTWRKDVDLFLVPSDFCRSVFIRGGFPEEQISVRPHFVPDPLPETHAVPPPLPEQARVLFLGRLSREKGLGTLLSAWPDVECATGAQLRLVGDGPLRAELEAQASGRNVSFAGHVPSERVMEEVAKASLIVLPSECYETFGRSIVEGYAMGRPAVVGRIGGPAEIVRDGETGLFFRPSDASDLAGKLARLLTDAELLRRLGEAGRSEYLALYSPQKAYARMMNQYERVLQAGALGTPG